MCVPPPGIQILAFFFLVYAILVISHRLPYLQRMKRPADTGPRYTVEKLLLIAALIAGAVVVVVVIFDIFVILVVFGQRPCRGR